MAPKAIPRILRKVISSIVPILPKTLTPSETSIVIETLGQYPDMARIELSISGGRHDEYLAYSPANDIFCPMSSAF
jgi:hypothetical protein